MKIKNIFFFISFVFCIFWIYACSASEEVESLAKEEARKLTKTQSIFENYSCRDFRVASIKELEVRRASIANGIDKKWRVNVVFIKCQNKCYDANVDIFVIRKNSEIIVGTVFD